MKSPSYLKYTALAAGLIGCALRVAVYISGTDGKGLPVAGHWSQSGLLVLTAAAFTFFLLLTRTVEGPAEFSGDGLRSLSGGIGSLIAAFAFFLAGIPHTMGSAFQTAAAVLRFASVLSLCIVAFCRFTGRKPFFLLHGIVCLWLAMRMVSLYRLWSSDPQLIDYGFYLGAYIAMMLTCYQLAAFDAGCGSHQKLWFWGLVSVYLCAVSLSGNQEPLILLLCMIWILTSLRRPAPAGAAPAPEEA